MIKKYTREQLMKFSNEEILEKTNGKAVNFHLTNGRKTQLCVNDLQGLDIADYSFNTKTEIEAKNQSF